MRQLKKYMTIYPKLLLTFFIVLVPLCILGLQMNASGSEHVKKEITNSMQSKVQFYNQQLETEFTRIITMIKEFSTYDELGMFVNGSEILNAYEKRDLVMKLQKGLSVIRSSSVYVEEASVYFPSIRRTITSTDYLTMDESEFEALNVVNNIYETPFLSWNDRIFISFPYPIASKEIHPEFVISVELSKHNLTDALSRFSATDSGGAFLINSGGEWTVSGDRAAIELPHRKWGDGITMSGMTEYAWNGEHYLIAYEFSNSLGTTLLMYEPEREIFGPLQQFNRWFWGLSAFSLIIVFFVSYMVYRFIHQPLRRLVNAFRKVERGDLRIEIAYGGEDEFHYLYAQFNKMVQNLQQLIYEVFEQKYRAQHAELKQLQSQINPHFLYNSLFILYRLAKKNGDDTQINFTRHLAEYFQFLTRSSSDEVTLKEEMKHVGNYIDIQTYRFAGQIRVVIDELPEKAETMSVPRLIVQPIVENAYKYALENNESGGILHIRYEEMENKFLIIVEDNGQQLAEADIAKMNERLQKATPERETTGLLNIHKRIGIQFGEAYGVSLSTSPMDGLKVTLSLPHPDSDNNTEQ